MCGIGRLTTRGHAAPESALLAGRGVCVLLLTGWGIATPLSMYVPALALLVTGLGALLWPQARLRARDWCVLARIVVLALPLLAIMASARPSLPDTWLNLLPNAVYLYDHGFFPAMRGRRRTPSSPARPTTCSSRATWPGCCCRISRRAR